MNSSEQASTGKPDVFFVTRKWPPAIGGMETYSVKLSEALAEFVNVEIVALPGRSGGRPPSALALLAFPFTVAKRWFRRKRPADVIHLGDMAIWPLAFVALFSRPRIAISAHGTDVAYHRRRTLRGACYGLYLKLGARLLRRASVIANSAATADVAKETGWRDSVIVPLATDAEGAAPDGTHNGRILFVGRLVERKGCAWFIENVLPRLPEGIALDVAGTVWSAAEGAALENPRVRFHGPLTGEALQQACREALCVVVPNIPVASGEYEGFGLVAPEAAAMGALVLAADCDGLRDAVIDRETGILVPPADADPWVAAIAEISAWDSAQRVQFLGAARSRVVEHFNWRRVARETAQAYAKPRMRDDHHS